MTNVIPTAKEIGQRILSVRNSKKMSRRDVLEGLKKLGIPMFETSLRRAETEAQPLRIHEAIALSAIYEMDLYELCGLDKDYHVDVARRALEEQAARLREELAEIEEKLRPENEGQ
ncbi:hypothetical protein EAH68_12720 [Corynebacterium hylobatis]|uniref:XRE family transcriptional regulator n=1 Tax=Corynebacterium hylobatis TaxID=1859290 RepID=A0A3S0BZP0_9CORY|nr:hypothetical protein [Corynebacterium hylobatis]RSZ61522.1 hypothetical protein EAH68_12720 [Corynebacterium hylobatis]